MIELLFWFFVAILFYIYLGYPIFLILSRGLFKASKSNSAKGRLPTITIFIPVYNEESVIENKITNSFDLNYPTELIEIVVASDGSTDRTNEITRQFEKKGLKVYINDSNEGKNATINKFVPHTKGEIIVFTDANSIFSIESLNAIIHNFNDPRVGCVGGKLTYLEGDSLTAKGEGVYFKYENSIRELEGLGGVMVGANGAIYAIRRELFIPVPPHVPNDFFHPLSVLKRGYRSVFESNAIAFEKPTENQGEEFNRRVRIVTRSFGALVEIQKRYGLFTGRGFFNIISHKILRWFAFPLMLISYILSLILIQKTIYASSFILLTLFYLLGLAGFVAENLGVKIKLFYIPYYFLLINIAAVIGVIRYFRNKKVVTWRSASTTR